MGKLSLVRKDFYQLIGKRTGAGEDFARAVIEEYEEYIATELTKGNPVRFDDFGTFRRTTWKARTYQTKNGPKLVPERFKVSFDEHKRILDRINA